MKSSKFTSLPLFPRQTLVALLLPLIAEQALSVTIGLAGHSDGILGGRSRRVRREPCGQLQHPDDPDHERPGHRRRGGHQPVHRPSGAENAKAAAAQILFSAVQLQRAGGGGGHRRAATPSCRGIFGSIDADVMHYAETYFLLSALSYPFIGLYNAGAALFRAQGNSKISMLSSLVMNVVNIGGNAVLIYGFGMGSWARRLPALCPAPLPARWCCTLLQKPDCALRVDSLRAMAPNGGLIRRILRVGILPASRTGCSRSASCRSPA